MMYNWCFWTVVLEKTLESPLNCKEIPPVHPKGNQSWVFIGRTDAEAETAIIWPPDGKNWLFGKDPDAGKEWRRKEKGTTEDEMVGWHLWCDEHEFEQALGVGEGQGSLACCSPWGRKESGMTEPLNWTEITYNIVLILILGVQHTDLIYVYIEKDDHSKSSWHPSPHLVKIFFFFQSFLVMRTFKVPSVGNYPIHNTVLLVTDTSLCITSLEFIFVFF